MKDWEDPEKGLCLPLANDQVKTVIFQFGSRPPFLSDCGAAIMNAENISTYLHANVVEIATNETGRIVNSLHVACLEGNRFSVSSKLFILALGGIETPRLLLLSNRIHKCGIGNEHDLVGRYFMEHLHFWFGFYVPSQSAGLRMMDLYRNIHMVKKVPIIGKLALSEKTLRCERLANGCIQLIPRIVLKESIDLYLNPSIESKGVVSFKALRSATKRGKMPEHMMKQLFNVFRDFDDVIQMVVQKGRRKIDGVCKKRSVIYRLAHMTEQVPNSNSRVSLGKELDRLGLRQPKLDWQISEIDQYSTIRMREIIDEELRRAGLGGLCIPAYHRTPLPGLHGGYHHMGTTRMHDNTKKGVVDKNCRVHGISNLFIAGSSVFPTGGYANPVLTIVALAVRLSDHVKKIMAA